MNSRISAVSFTADMLNVGLTDGRIISVPLAWYPRLLDASASALQEFRIIGRGTGVHWEGLDEDLSLDGIIQGIPSRPEKVA